MKWKPIETAPRDGTWVLCIVAGFYEPGVPFIPSTCRWGWSDLDEAEGWLEPDASVGTDTITYASYTHWMPLPEPPAPPEDTA